jgi:N-acetylneuraminic acid mutarotase
LLELDQTTTRRRIAAGLAVLCATAVSAILSPAVAHAADQAAAWETIPDFPVAITDQTVAQHNGVIYAGIGWTGFTTRNITSLYSYSPGDPGWRQLASAPSVRSTAVSAFIGEKLYVASGWEVGANPQPRTDIYDPATNTWTAGAPHPHPAGGSGSAVLRGKLYTIGGCPTQCGAWNRVDVYDPATNTWSTAAAYPSDIAYPACDAVGDRIYCAGGASNPRAVKSGYSYDPDADKWSPIADLPTETMGAAHASAAGELLVQGGYIDGGWTVSRGGWAYDPATDGWSALPPSNTPIGRGGGTGYKSSFYKVGGDSRLEPSPQATAEVLNLDLA